MFDPDFQALHLRIYLILYYNLYVVVAADLSCPVSFFEHSILLLLVVCVCVCVCVCVVRGWVGVSVCAFLSRSVFFFFFFFVVLLTMPARARSDSLTRGRADTVATIA